MPVAVDETRLGQVASTSSIGVLHTGNILGKQLEAIEPLLGVSQLERPPTAPVSEALSIFKKWTDIAAVSPQLATQTKTTISETSQCVAKLLLDTRRSDLDAVAVSAIAHVITALSIPQFESLTIELCPTDISSWQERGHLLRSICISLKPFASAGIHLAGLDEEQIPQLLQSLTPLEITGFHLSPSSPPPPQALRSLCDEWGWRLFCGGFPNDIASESIFDQTGCCWILSYTIFDRYHSILQQTGYFFGACR